MEDPLRREVTLYALNERGHMTEKREEARTRKRERKGKGKKESEKENVRNGKRNVKPCRNVVHEFRQSVSPLRS